VIPRLLLAAGVVCLAVAALLRQPLTAYRLSTGSHPRRANEQATDEDRLWFSVDALRDLRPQLSADRTLSPRQRRGAIVVLAAVAVALLLFARGTIVFAVGTMTVVYFSSMLLRIRLYHLSLNGKGLIRISDDYARSVPDTDLPSYSVLVPAFHEPEVCERLVANLRRLEYPADRLEIFLLLEEDDTDTIEAASAAVAEASDIRIVLIPNREPRTKPKALNYGLTLSRGALVTIFDAEDRPDPLQLRKAAIAFSAAPPEVVCLQAQLAFFNPTQNLITKWFAIEYAMWFSQLLPGLAQLDAPIPLGGTSNHFRRDVLLDLMAWDPFNVTEDADLGVRMRRAGYRSAVIDSVTEEEANSDFINWIKQRSRWYKGYAQTLLVHLREPLALLRELGVKEFLLLLLFVGGTPLLSLLNPIFWTLTALWWIGHPVAIRDLFPTAIYFAGLTCWIAGNFIFAYMCMLSVREPAKAKLRVAAVLMPVYWVMMSLAALKAAIQLLSAPSYWEKTTHGLDRGTVVEGSLVGPQSSRSGLTSAPAAPMRRPDKQYPGGTA
jgi:cellulose synthase/poly-beta-1,6-N-acetylglucosamine synthase-like glycosyltransferase